MQVTSLLSHHEHEHGPDCGCGHDHEHSVVHLWQDVLGVVFVLNALKDLRVGRLSINELVAIAVLFAFASGAFGSNMSAGYKTAGLIAFLMLMGELIEI